MSTEQQENSPERQREKFATYCKRYNLVQAGEYDDLGVSATKTKMMDRPGIMRMWADAADDLFDVVWAEETSRASRDMIETLQLLEYLATMGIPFVDGNEDPRQMVDPTYKKIITAIKAGFAEGETKRMSIRIRDTMASRVRAGRYCGQKMPPGLKWTAEGIFIDEETVELTRRTFELFVSIGSFCGTVRQLNTEGFLGARGSRLSIKSVKTILQHPAYRGKYIWKGEEQAIEAPEVIDPVTLKKCDEMLAQRVIRPQRTTHAAAIFSGLFRCPECGVWMSSAVNGNGKKLIRCRRAHNPPHVCGNRRVMLESKIERLLLPRVLRELHERVGKVQLKHTTKRRQLDTATKLARIEESKRREMDMYADQLRTKDEMMARLKVLEAAKDELLAQQEEPEQVTAEKLRGWARTLEREWPECTGSQKRDLLQAMISYMILDYENPAQSQIFWRSSA